MGMGLGMLMGSTALRLVIPGGDPAPIFDINFDDGDALPGVGVFSRSTTALTLDHEDIYRYCQAEELRFKGLRRVENLFTASGTPATQTITELVVGATYAFHFRGSGTGDFALTDAVTQDPVDEGEGFTFIATTTSLTATYTAGTPGPTISVQLEEISGSYTLNFDAGTTAFVDGETVTGAGGASAFIHSVVLESGTWAGNDAAGYFLIGATAAAPFVNNEALTGSASGAATADGIEQDRAPSEYVDIDTTYNAEVAGVRYFTTTNGNTFSAPGPGTVTEATGSTIAAATREGVLVEPAETNLAPESNDFTSWVAQGATVSQNQTGIDGRDNSAALIEDTTTGFEWVEDTITISSTGHYTVSIWVLKETYPAATYYSELHFTSGSFGLANFSSLFFDKELGLVFDRGGAGIPTINSHVVDAGDWWIVRFTINATSTDTGVLRLFPSDSTNHVDVSGTPTGDITIGQVDFVKGDVASSPIRTAGSSVTRNTDVLTMPFARAAPWTMFQDCKPQITVDVAAHALMGYDNVNDEAQIVRATTSYDGELFNGTDNPKANVTDATTSYTMGDRLKVAMSSDDGDQVRLGFNGSSASDTTGGVVNTSGYATMGIGQKETGGADIPITIRQAQFLSIAKTTGELETLTTI